MKSNDVHFFSGLRSSVAFQNIHADPRWKGAKGKPKGRKYVLMKFRLGLSISLCTPDLVFNC